VHETLLVVTPSTIKVEVGVAFGALGTRGIAAKSTRRITCLALLAGGLVLSSRTLLYAFQPRQILSVVTRTRDQACILVGHSIGPDWA
jgi:hypothetical protein